MTTDESILEEMLDRATNPTKEAVDELGVQMFWMVVKSNTQLVHKSQEMIVSKIKSNNITEALRAIGLLEECMNKCVGEFQDEAAKFRFLNELIRLVSKNYNGATTPEPIKKRIMECLLLWTIHFPQKTKIREAYDMLNKEGAIEHGNSVKSSINKRESVMGADEKMLSKLLKSNNPEDYKRANLLIQHRVNQEAKRIELTFQHKIEIQEVQNTVSLLNQMLDRYEEDDKIAENSETMSLLSELFSSCKKHKPIIQRLPELVEQTDENLIGNVLETNDLLQSVVNRYKNIIKHTKEKAETSSNHKGQVSPSITATGNNTDLLSELLGDTLAKSSFSELESLQFTKQTMLESKLNSNKDSALDDLKDVFNNMPESTATEALKNSTKMFDNINLLEPEIVTSKVEEIKTAIDKDASTGKQSFKELHEIDKISEKLLMESLKENNHVKRFKAEPKKLSLNELSQEKTATLLQSPSKTPAATQSTMTFNSNLNDIDNILNEKTTNSDINQCESDTVVTTNEILSNTDDSKNFEDNVTLTDIRANELPFKHLSDIMISLDDIVPTKEEHVLMDDDDVKVTLCFTENRPSKNVSVIVMSVSNKSQLVIKDFQFEASVKKPSKVRLLPATASEIAAHKSFRPPAPINQVLLLLNPTGESVDITCIIGYKLGDDPDPIKESIVAKNIPYV